MSFIKCNKFILINKLLKKNKYFRNKFCFLFYVKFNKSVKNWKYNWKWLLWKYSFCQKIVTWRQVARSCSKWLHVAQLGAKSGQKAPLGFTWSHIFCGSMWLYLANCSSHIRDTLRHLTPSGAMLCLIFFPPHGVTLRHILINNLVVEMWPNKKNSCTSLSYISPHSTTKWYLKMWLNVAEKKFFITTLRHLATKCGKMARICEPQFARLSYIKPQKMWRQVEPHGPKWRFYDKWSISTVYKLLKKLKNANEITN